MSAMTPPHYEDSSVVLHHGDCLNVLRQLPDASVDSVVTDPPYGLEFMGKDWDAPWKPSSVGRGVRVESERSAEMTERGTGHATAAGPYLAARVDSVRVAGKPFQDWCEAWASECLRVLKPGGHMVAFGGSRTWHRLAAAVEDAGFEIRDSIAWLYGSGFPKSLDVSKAIDKAAGAQREDGEPVRDRVSHLRGERYASGPAGFSTERGTTLSARAGSPVTPDAQRWEGWGTALKPAFEPIVVGRKPLDGTVAATVLAHGTGALNIGGTRVAMSAADRDAARVPMRGASPAKVGTPAGRAPESFDPAAAGRWPANVLLDNSQAAELDKQTGILTSGKMAAGTQRAPRDGVVYGRLEGDATPRDTPGDSGGASRFFPTFRYEAKAPTHERPNVDGVAHPTVKPLDLMRWLVRLVTPPGGVVLEPFAGSGTTAEACVVEGFRCIAIEREADYLPLIIARLTKPIEIALDLEGVA